jgi:hypothetical protein
MYAAICSGFNCWAQAADPWADEVVSYVPGANPDVGYTDPATALGKPTLFTDPAGMYPGVVTPFSPSFGLGETVSIGMGGSLAIPATLSASICWCLAMPFSPPTLAARNPWPWGSWAKAGKSR